MIEVLLLGTSNRKCTDMSSSRKCKLELWKTKVGQLTGAKEDVKTLNLYLDKMKAGFTAAHPDLCAADAEISAWSIK